MPENEIRSTGPHSWVVRWPAEPGRTKQPRTHAAFVTRRWNKKKDATEFHCFYCKRSNDCDHVIDVVHFQAAHPYQPKES